MSPLPAHNHEVPVRPAQYEWRKPAPVWGSRRTISGPAAGYLVNRYPYQVAASLLQMDIPMEGTASGLGSGVSFPMSSGQGSSEGVVVVGRAGGEGGGYSDAGHPDQGGGALIGGPSKRGRPGI